MQCRSTENCNQISCFCLTHTQTPQTCFFGHSSRVDKRVITASSATFKGDIQSVGQLLW